MSVTGDFSITTRYTVTSSTGTAGSVKETVSKSYATTYADGTTSNKFDRAWSESITLTGTSKTYDLTSLAGPTGTVTFAEVIEVVIAVTAAPDPAVLTIGGEGSADEWSNPFGADGDKMKILTGGRFALVAPSDTAYAVAAGNKLFKVDAGAYTIGYDIEFKGRTA